MLTSSQIENNNRTQARGVAFTNNDVHGTAGTPEAVGENVLNSSYNGSRAFNGSNGGYGLNDTTGNMVSTLPPTAHGTSSDRHRTT